MFGFGRREIPSTLDGTGIDVGHAGGLPGEIHIENFFVAISYSGSTGSAGAHFLAGSAAVCNSLHIIELNLSILQRLNDDVEVSDSERCARDLKNIGAQVCDLLLYVDVCSLHQCHYSNERCHAHGQTEHRQRGAELMRAQRAEGFGQVVADGEHEMGGAVQSYQRPSCCVELDPSAKATLKPLDHGCW